MNKKLKTIVFSLLMMSLACAASAQSNFYHLVGDTVIGRCPIYYYDWWPTVDSLGRVPDSAVACTGHTNGYYRYSTSDTLKVIGIASALTYIDHSDPGNPVESCDTTMDTAMYYILFDETPSGPVELARVCWTEDYNTHPKRYMVLPQTLSTNPQQYCKTLVPGTYVASLREYYFDNPVLVSGGFFLGWEYQTRFIGNDERGTNLAIYSINHSFHGGALRLFEGFQQLDCALGIPWRSRMYKNVGDTDWQYSMEQTYHTVFLIIEVDTTALIDSTLFTCPPPETPTLIIRDNYWARIEWVDNSNLRWEVSVTTPGGDPDSGRIISTTNTSLVINGLNPDSTYNVYVRGWCQVSQWEGYGTWSAPLAIGAVPHEGVAEPDDKNCSLIPNPATQRATVTSSFGLERIEVYDSQGRQTLTLPATGYRTTLDLSTWPRGTYLLRILTPLGTTTKKLLVQ